MSNNTGTTGAKSFRKSPFAPPMSSLRIKIDLNGDGKGNERQGKDRKTPEIDNQMGVFLLLLLLLTI